MRGARGLTALAAARLESLNQRFEQADALRRRESTVQRELDESSETLREARETVKVLQHDPELLREFTSDLGRTARKVDALRAQRDEVRAALEALDVEIAKTVRGLLEA